MMTTNIPADEQRNVYLILSPILMLASLACLLLGLFLPTLTMNPPDSELYKMATVVDPSLNVPRKTLSIAGSILELMTHGEHLIGLAIFLFSIVFPLAKLLCIFLAYLRIVEGRELHGIFRLMEKAGKLSMLDVFVLAILLLVCKTLPGNIEMRLQIGVYFFGASVLISLFLPSLLHRLRLATPLPAKFVCKKASSVLPPSKIIITLKDIQQRGK